MVAPNPHRRESDLRLDEMERKIESIENTVLAGEDAFRAHEAAGKARWDAVQKSLDEMNATFARIAIYKNTVDKHETLLYGDGDNKPGFIVKMDRLTNAMDDLKKLGWLLVGLLSSAIIGLLINAVIHAAAAK